MTSLRNHVQVHVQHIQSGLCHFNNLSAFNGPDGVGGGPAGVGGVGSVGAGCPSVGVASVGAAAFVNSASSTSSKNDSDNQ